MIKSIIAAAACALGVGQTTAYGATLCRVAHHGTEIELQSPEFTYTLDTAQGLRALSWQNHLTGRSLSLGLGAEVSLDFDAADQRIWISGWKHEGDKRTTHVFLPQEAEGKKLTLTLGGFGLFDYREIDVNLNGVDLGTRHAAGRWREPGEFNLSPGSQIHDHLRFGEDNILVIHCREPIMRTARMDNEGLTTSLPGKNTWPGQFEQYLTVGDPLSTPPLRVVTAKDDSTPENGKYVAELESEDKRARVTVTYQWNATEAILRKFIEVQNRSKSQRRLMNARLGDYPTDMAVSDGEQGFPVYLGNEFFMSVAHPSGWAIGQDKRVLLRQYPGKMLAPGESFQCMEVVLGAAKASSARDTFIDYVRSRSRRTLHGHDKPYGIYDTFGANVVNGKETEEYMLNEKYVLGMLDKFVSGQREAHYQFDYCNTHFWVDHNGDLERFDPIRFPNGLTNIKAKLDEIGVQPGLWIDSSWAAWSIGGNPLVHRDFTYDPAYEEDGFNGEVILCRASDPIRTLYSTAFAYHIREEGVRLIKCDNLRAICYNPGHSHLPGVYSTEAIQSAVIQTMHDWDAVNPDVFIMLYWGYRSPWWLLHGDTLFESGLGMEAASFGPTPTLYVRDGVTVGLDQGQWWRRDVPPLGKDTLGIWLSDWSWNSHIGKERWQDGFAMDLCRGSMLAQIWTDYNWLSAPERKQLADFIAILKARPECFSKPHFIIGDPFKREPYGYCCTDGKKAFIALNNCTWSDVAVPLELNSKWGLPDGGQWDIYRWHPDPAQLQSRSGSFGQTPAVSLRPFEVVLLEIEPAGQPPALKRDFAPRPMPDRFSEPSGPVALDVALDQEKETAGQTSPWQILKPISAISSAGTMLAMQPDLSLLAGGRNETPDTYTILADTDLTNITAFKLEVLPDPSLPEGGPGRAPNGNFVLSEFRARARAAGDASPPAPVGLKNPIADFSQETFGGWPVSAALDGDPATGWQIDPEEGAAHEAIFETTQPVAFPGGAALAFTLQQTTPAQHTLGRFRLSATTALPPFRVKTNHPGKSWLVKGQVPACSNGGILVVSIELAVNGQPRSFDDSRLQMKCQGLLAGREISAQPVLPTPCDNGESWQAWRIELKPSATSQPFAFKINAKLPAGVKTTFAGHFIPADEL